MLPIGGLVTSATALITFADPVPFPESRTYEFDFETDPEEAGWTLEAWIWDFIPEGVEEVATVRDSSSGFQRSRTLSTKKAKF